MITQIADIIGLKIRIVLALYENVDRGINNLAIV